MNDLDYSGDMKFYQDQLLKKGITVEMLDMNNYAECTARELQGIVDNTHLKKRSQDV